MITNQHSWSLGFSSRRFAKGKSTPNKSADHRFFSSEFPHRVTSSSSSPQRPQSTQRLFSFSLFWTKFPSFVKSCRSTFLTLSSLRLNEMRAQLYRSISSVSSCSKQPLRVHFCSFVVLWASEVLHLPFVCIADSSFL